MPTGIEDFNDPPAADVPGRAEPIRGMIDHREVDPYISVVTQLRDSGLIPDHLARGAIVGQLRRTSWPTLSHDARRAVSGSRLTDEQLLEFRRMSRPQVRRSGDVSTFIPREQTESFGFLRLLELFSVFNYAIAGALDAAVNKARGQEDESSILVEAWRGFTLKDRETFSDVFKNLGWKSEDGFGYWTRESLGFVSDVILDPLNLVTMGVGSAAARVAGRISGSAALRSSKVAFSGGRRVKPIEVLGKIAGEIADESLEAARSGGLDLSRIGATASDTRKIALAEIAEVHRRTQQLEMGLPSVKSGLRELAEKEREWHVRSAVMGDVYALFDRLVYNQDTAGVFKLRQEAGDGMTGLGRFVSLLTGATREGDIHMASTLVEKLLAEDGLDFTADNVMSWLSKGSSKLFDPGGLKLKLPFTGEELVLLHGRWMDSLKLAISENFAKFFGKSAAWLTSEKRPSAIRALTAGAIAVKNATAEFTAQSTESLKRAFGVTKGRNLYLASIIKERAALKDRASQQILRANQQDIGMRVAGKKELRALDPSENEVLFDAIVAEEEAALDWKVGGLRYFDEKNAKREIETLRAQGKHADADSLEAAYAGRLGYKEKHLESIIMGDKRLAHRSAAERKELLDLARKIDAHWRADYDQMTEEGLDFLFMDFYLPSQYANIHKLYKSEFKQGALSMRMSADDPYTRVRKLRRSQAVLPPEQGGMGLVPIKDVFALVYGRRMAAQNAQIERMFAGKFIDNLAIHPDQIDATLRHLYGPAGNLGSQVSSSIRRRTLARDFWTERGLLRAVPRLQELRDLYERGFYEEAVRWIEQNPDQISSGILHGGEDGLYAAVHRGVGESIGALDHFTTSVAGDVQMVADKMAETIGRTADQLRERGFVARGKADSSVQFAADLSLALEQRVASRLGVTPEKVAESRAAARVASTAKAPKWAGAHAQAGEDAARLVIMDEILLDARSAQVPEALEKQLGKQLDEWADDIANVIRSREAEGLSRGVREGWSGIDETMALLYARMAPVYALETAITDGGHLVAGEIASGAVLDRIAKLARMIEEGKPTNQYLDEVWDAIGKDIGLLKKVEQWRLKHKLSEVPFGEFTREAREAIVQWLDATRKSLPDVGIEFDLFKSSPYSTGLGKVRPNDKISKKIEGLLRRYAKGDNELFSHLMKLVFTPGSFRAGLHWQPFAGIRGLLNTEHAARASRFVDRLRETAIGSTPDGVLKRVRENKLKVDAVAYVPHDSPRVLLDSEVVAVRAATSKLKKSLVDAAERVGASPGEFRQAVDDLTSAIEASIGRRGWDETITTDQHVALDDAIAQLTPLMKQLYRDVEAGKLLEEETKLFQRDLQEVNQQTSELVREAKKIRQGALTFHNSASRIAGPVPAELESLHDETLAANEMFTDKVVAMAGSVYDRSAQMMTELDDVPIGKTSKLVMADDPVVGSFWRIADDFRGDQNRVPDGLMKGHQKSREWVGESLLATMREDGERLQQSLDRLRPRLESLRDEAAMVTRLSEALNAPSPFAGRGATIDRWLWTATAESFLSAGGKTEGDWLAAVERVLEHGPSSAELRAPWEKHLKGKWSVPEPVADAVRRSMLTPPHLQESAAAWRSARRLSTGRPLPPAGGVRRITEKALAEGGPLLEWLGVSLEDFSRILQEELSLAAKAPAGEDLIQRFLDAAFIPSEEAAATIAAWRAELAEARAVDGLFSRLEGMAAARAQGPDLESRLAPLVEALVGRLPVAMQDAATVSAAYGGARQLATRLLQDSLAGRPERVREALLATGIRTGPGDPLLDAIAREAEALGAATEEKALSDLVSQFRDSYYEDVTRAYEEMAEVPDLGGQEGVRRALEDLASEGGLTLDERRTFDALTPDERARAVAFADSENFRGRRADYWLWRLGVPTDSARRTLPPGATVDFYRAAADEKALAGVRQAASKRAAGLRMQVADVLESNRSLIEGRAFTRTESDLYEKLVLPSVRKMENLGLQYTPDELEGWRSIHQLRNYFRMHVLRAEHDGLHQVLGNSLSASEVRFLKARRRMSGTATPGDLERIAEAQVRGVGGGDPGGEVLGSADRDTLDALSVLRWEGAEDDWRAVMGGPAARVSSRLGVHPWEHGDEAAFLEALGAAGVQVEIAPMGGAKIVPPPDAAVPGHELAELTAAVNDIIGTYRTLPKFRLSGAPALEGQVLALKAQAKKIAAKWVEEGADEQTVLATQEALIYALTGRFRSDTLTAVEAAHLIDYFGRKSASELFEQGQAATQLRSKDIFLGRRARGHLPRAELGGQVDDIAKKLTEDLPPDLQSPDELVRHQFPALEGTLSPSGVDMGTEQYIPRYMKQLLDDLVLEDRTLTGPAATIARNMWDPVTNSFKVMQTVIHPAFHVRNALDSTTRGLMAIGLKALNPRRNWQMLRILRGDDFEVQLGKERVSAAFIRDMFQRLGGTTDFTQQMGITRVDIAGVQDPRLSPWHQNFVLRGVKSTADVVNNIAGKADNMFRMAILIDGLERGLLPAEAMRYAQKYLFDYAHGLTPFEREWMRRVMPFYTFSRFNIPLMLETMYKRPGLIAALGKTYHMFRDDSSGDFETLVPSYVREQWMFAPKLVGNELHVYAGKNLLSFEEMSFLGDLSRWRDSGLKEGFVKEVFSRLNPMIKLPIELYAEKNLYFGSEIREDHVLTEAVWKWPVITEWLQLRQVKAGDDVVWRVNGHRWHALQQTHLARIYRTMNQFLGEDGGIDWSGMLPAITGVRMISVDLKRRMEHLEAVSQFNQKALVTALGQGDWAQMRRILGTTDRDDDRQQRVDEAFESLRQHVRTKGASSGVGVSVPVE